MAAPELKRRRASVTTSAKKISNSSGESTHPWRSPNSTPNNSEYSLSSKRLRARMSLWDWWNTETILGVARRSKQARSTEGHHRRSRTPFSVDKARGKGYPSCPRKLLSDPKRRASRRQPVAVDKSRTSSSERLTSPLPTVTQTAASDNFEEHFAYVLSRGQYVLHSVRSFLLRTRY